MFGGWVFFFRSVQCFREIGNPSQCDGCTRRFPRPDVPSGKSISGLGKRRPEIFPVFSFGLQGKEEKLEEIESKKKGKKRKITRARLRVVTGCIFETTRKCTELFFAQSDQKQDPQFFFQCKNHVVFKKTQFFAKK